MKRRGPGKAHSMAPFYVALRKAERRILRGAFEEFGTIAGAATALGITDEYFSQRGVHLGGVFPDQPEREPPGPLAEGRVNARSELGNDAIPTLAVRKRRDVKQRNGDDPVQRISSAPRVKTPRRAIGGGDDGAARRPEDRSE